MMTNVFVKADCVARHLIICVCDNGTEKTPQFREQGVWLQTCCFYLNLLQNKWFPVPLKIIFITFRYLSLYLFVCESIWVSCFGQSLHLKTKKKPCWIHSDIMYLCIWLFLVGRLKRSNNLSMWAQRLQRAVRYQIRTTWFVFYYSFLTVTSCTMI